MTDCCGILCLECIYNDPDAYGYVKLWWGSFIGRADPGNDCDGEDCFFINKTEALTLFVPSFSVAVR